MGTVKSTHFLVGNMRVDSALQGAIALFVSLLVSAIVFLDAYSLILLFVLIGVIFAVEAIGVTKNGWDLFGLHFLSKWDAAVVGIGVVGGMLVSALFSGILLLSPIEPAVHMTFRNNSSLTAGVFLTSVVVAPVFEEFLFRHIIQRRGLSWARPSVRVTLPTILFQALHISAYPGASLAAWLTVAVGIPASFAFAISYEVTDNLLVPILIHAIVNAVSVIGFYFIFLG